ncbi:MAG: hypothetical protein V2J65_19120 [Desulfobacteraceae bacterium]|jgi:hypothetical protein|nr:hypothetical protein [Desulfobacteraceae bacterium]
MVPLTLKGKGEIMVWNVEWDKGFIVGGQGNRRLTPNFRLKEFKSETGNIRVHRELVSALQILREHFAKSISVSKTDDDGLGAVIAGQSVTELLAAADRVKANHLFDQVGQQGDEVHVRIPNPDQLPEIELEQALETAFSMTSGFETSGDRFQQVTGNFDGAGLSFGPVQWNFKSNTLVPLFRKFQEKDESALRACFTDEIDYDEWIEVLDLPVGQQIAWANDISTGRGGHDVVQPWKGYLQAVGRVEKFRAIMVEQALRKYGTRLLKAVKYLQDLKPSVQIDHLRCLCSLYDLVIQQGSLNKARQAIETRVKQEDPQDQFHLVGIAVEERGRKAHPQWQADCVSRRLGILHGVPKTVEDRQRANINFYMLRDVRIRGAQELMTADVSDRLARVSKALASGDTLLA